MPHSHVEVRLTGGAREVEGRVRRISLRRERNRGRHDAGVERIKGGHGQAAGGLGLSRQSRTTDENRPRRRDQDLVQLPPTCRPARLDQP